MNDFSLNPTPSSVLLKLAERVKLLRREQKISQANMAESSGVSLGSLKRFEQSGEISLKSLLKLVHVLDRLNEFNDLLSEGSGNKQVEHLFD